MTADKTASAPAPPVETLSYEQAFTELEAVVAALEREEHSLEESLALYERGQALLAYCRRLLAQAELRVRTLTEVQSSSEFSEDDTEG